MRKLCWENNSSKNTAPHFILMSISTLKSYLL